MRDPGARASVQGYYTNLIAAEERGQGGMAEAARRAEEHIGESGPSLKGLFLDSGTFAVNRILACFMAGRFDEASQIEAATPWESQPEWREHHLAVNHMNRMWNYLHHGVQPTEDELSRFEAFGPFYASIPSTRQVVRDWRRAYDARKRRSYF